MATRKLAKYRSKRDFTKTAEPSGRQSVAASDQLRFVIQKHAARRLHYDLRLELGGVFKSWAVTRGPSLDPADKRLAVEVEDHPLDYGDFEGTIAHGEYGGGTVLLWDRGFWGAEGTKSPQAQLAAGELKFSVAGQKLNGSFVLVRMRNDRTGGKRTNWLLIKHRDEYATPGDGDSAIAQDLSAASGRTMEAIAAGKGAAPKPFMTLPKSKAKANAIWHSKSPQSPGGLESRAASTALRSAASRSTRSAKSPSARKSSSKAPPEFIPPQLAKLVENPPSGAAWAHEIKIDGYRLQLRAAGGEASVRTRKGLDWTEKFPTIAAAANAFPDCIIDGEVAAFDSSHTLSFHALQAALSDGDDSKLVYFVFDLLFEDGEDLRRLPLSERKQRLHALLERAGNPSPFNFVDHLESAGDAVLKSACNM
ncbi:MAG: DNA polymerase ligase N-terminal domain-containing protein, partial [Gammaproteobacteria bacterium]